MKKLWSVAAMILAMAAAQPAAAQTMTIGSNATGSGGMINQPLKPASQSVQAPAGYPWIHSYSLWIINSSPTLSVKPVIYEWTGPNTLGPVVWSGPITTITEAAYTEFSFSPNIQLDPAKTYLLSIQNVVSGESGRISGNIVDNVPGHYFYWNGTMWTEDVTGELHFTATFGVAPVPAPIPTLSEWAMILLGVGLAGGAALMIHRRRRET